MKRTATAQWRGGLKDGKGAISTASGVLKSTPYSFTTRFENGPGTNPEELIAAAHAGCFSMALAHQLGEAGLKNESIETTAGLTLEKLDKGWTITEVKLVTKVKLANGDEAAFRKAAETAKANCPVSRLLNAKITLDAKVEIGATI
ncbi:MAG: OsmC family protein [Planctomycetota bacterium]